MTYTEAVEAALRGEEYGYTCLYEMTYKSKLYLAIQYMKNESAAQDVLQDAYMKAFSRLHTLNEPEKFSSWLGQIVANTAKNELARKNPTLFSDLEYDEEVESFEFQIEDEAEERQPELAYTREETRQLVQQLIGTLSDEQRLAVLLFHIEGVPIKDIAEIMGCSENTVKSRLNYGRKNIKAKAEELQKKGYKLYGLAPIPFLLWLLREDAFAMEQESAFLEAGNQVAQKIFRESEAQSSGAVSAAEAAGASANAAAGTAGGANAGILGTVIGKVTVAVIAASVIGAAAFGMSTLVIEGAASLGLLSAVTSDEEADEAAETQEEEPVEPEEEEIPVIEEEEEQESELEEEDEDEDEDEEEHAVSDKDYPKLLEGELTKDEFQFVLAYGPDSLTEEGISEKDRILILNQLTQSSYDGESMVSSAGTDASYRQGYAVDEVNRLFSVFTDFQFKENDSTMEDHNITVEGDTVWFTPAEMNFTAEAEIVEASYIRDEMTVIYHYTKTVEHFDTGSDTTEETYRMAKLQKNRNDKFQIVSISDIDYADEEDTESSAGTETEAAAVDSSSAYSTVLQQVQNGTIQFQYVESSVEGYWYFLADLDGDGAEELVVGAEFLMDVFSAYDCLVFKAGSSGASQVDGEIVILSATYSSDGVGFWGTTDISRGTGQQELHKITVSGTSLVSSSDYRTLVIGSDETTQFFSANPTVEWYAVSDLSGLSS